MPLPPRPKYLNLLQIRLPLPGVLSIFHRISGVLLIGALPFGLLALQCSIDSAEGYAAVAKFTSYAWVKIAIWGVAWALFHHLCAGVRFLLLDCHIGVSLEAARFSAVVAFVVSIVLTVLFDVWLWV